MTHVKTNQWQYGGRGREITKTQDMEGQARDIGRFFLQAARKHSPRLWMAMAGTDVGRSPKSLAKTCAKPVACASNLSEDILSFTLNSSQALRSPVPLLL